MKDAIEARLWADHHEDFADGIDMLVSRIRGAIASVPIIARAMLIVLAVSIANLGLAQPVFAQTTEVQPRQVAVPYSPTDIVTPEGAARLDARLRGSARELCQPATVGAIGEVSERRRCYATALQQARRQAAAAQVRVAANQNRLAGSR